MTPDMHADILRLWTDEPGVEDDLYAILDRAVSARRTLPKGPERGEARLAEGLCRIRVARQMAEWENRSYAIQALEAGIDSLRDALLELAADAEPNAEEVTAYRSYLLEQWRAAQSDDDMERITALETRGLGPGEQSDGAKEKTSWSGPPWLS